MTIYQQIDRLQVEVERLQEENRNLREQLTPAMTDKAITEIRKIIGAEVVELRAELREQTERADKIKEIRRDKALWLSRARNLAVMVRRLMRAIHQYEIDVEDPMPGPCSAMLQQADDMLVLYGLRGSVLRNEE